MKNDPILKALDELDQLDPISSAGQQQLAKALSAKSNLVIAKAARIACEFQVAPLREALAAAFMRLLSRGAAADKGCAALTAIARSLYALDFDEAQLYLAGTKHRQLEGSFGPPVDAAADLRAVCAMGLASTVYRDKLRVLVDLLADPEWQVRAGAVRAIAATGSDTAALLLRLKALNGDEETEVLAECFSGLLQIDGGEAISFLEPFAVSRSPEISEAALLALGSSRKPEAIEWLMTRFRETASAQARNAILLSLAASRTETAIQYLLEIIRSESEQASAAAVAALEIHRDQRIGSLIEEAVRRRSDYISD